MLTFAKVVRDVITSTLTGGGTTGTGAQQAAVCPPRMSTGFFPGGAGEIPRPRPGNVPGTWIGPTLIFPGVINPGIPSTIPFANTIVATTTGNQIQVANAVPTTTTTTGNVTTAGTITT